jgi:OOP family OmpA-OmpF porin
MTEPAAMRRWRRAFALAALLLGACAHNTGTVVLLPQQDGRASAVAVKQGGGEVVLGEPYAAARQTSRGAPQPFVATPQDVQALAGPALAAQPARPTRFTLYFVEGKDEFTEESKRLVRDVMATIAQRQIGRAHV